LKKNYGLQKLCKDAPWVRVDDLSSLSQSITNSIRPEAQASGAVAQASAGEASFFCSSTQGFVFVTAVLASSPKGSIQVWAVYKLSGFLSTDPMRSMQTRTIMEHMVATWTISKKLGRDI